MGTEPNAARGLRSRPLKGDGKVNGENLSSTCKIRVHPCLSVVSTAWIRLSRRNWGLNRRKRRKRRAGRKMEAEKLHGTGDWAHHSGAAANEHTGSHRPAV